MGVFWEGLGCGQFVPEKKVGTYVNWKYKYIGYTLRYTCLCHLKRRGSNTRNMQPHMSKVRSDESINLVGSLVVQRGWFCATSESMDTFEP